MKASELINKLQSYLKHTKGDCELLIFDEGNGTSYGIKSTSTDNNFVFFHLSSDKYIPIIGHE